MADGRDIAVWDNHAQENRVENSKGRRPFKFDDEDHVSMGGWLRHKITSVVIPGGGTQVVDVGCGPGYWQELFAGMNYNGFDQSTEMLKLAAEMSPNLSWAQGNARELIKYWELESFDLVFTSAVLQHNRHTPDKTEIVKGFYEIIKPGGYYLCTEDTFRADNRPESVGVPEFTNGYSFTPYGWEKYMKSLGFKLLDFNGKSEYFYQRM